MFWVDKQNPNVLFADIRNEEHTLCDGRSLEIKPDVEMDFTKMTFPDDSFKMVIFDPPHLNRLGKSSWMAKKYGVLLPTWEMDIREGFNECMRVLEPYGTLIFKWNESQIKQSQILNAIGENPLITQRAGKGNNTIWMVYMKIPKSTI